MVVFAGGIYMKVLQLASILSILRPIVCEINPKTFDYVIIGGGTSGLVLANRLSEDPNTSVAVIEAGDSVFNNPNVTNTTTFGLNLGTSIDWQYTSTLQAYGGNKTVSYNQGKALGGTSTINGMTFIRPQDVQIDLWEKLGNKGWNWTTLFTHSKLSERFVPPTPSQAALGAAYNPSYHGFDGHLVVGWQSTVENGGAHVVLNDTWSNLGVPYVEDVNGGKLRGFSVWPFTQKDDIRQDSARAYYWPIFDQRSNLKVFTNTTATRILWKDDTSKNSLAVADSVEVIGLNGSSSLISAAREVIVSVGSIRSPALLERSGVGNPQILQEFEIPIVVELPSVGENLQDQANNAITAAANHSWEGYPPYVSYLNAQDIFGRDSASLEAHIRAQIPSYASLIAQNSNGAFNASVQERLLTTQADLIFKDNIPLVEILSAPFTASMSFAFWTLLPFARGSVHINSRDALAQPAINPNFFEVDVDLTIQAEAARISRQALGTAPLNQFIGTEIVPGFATVPENADDQAWHDWVISSYGSNLHPIGTCAMLPRELGGVVDSQLKVYGTQNVRVVDASILPFQICGHLTSALYAVAERASEIIKQAHN